MLLLIGAAVEGHDGRESQVQGTLSRASVWASVLPAPHHTWPRQLAVNNPAGKKLAAVHRRCSALSVLDRQSEIGWGGDGLDLGDVGVDVYFAQQPLVFLFVLAQVKEGIQEGRADPVQ